MNEKSKENIKKAHIYCRTNRKILTKSSRCGCFYCLKIFEPKEIKDWCDNGTTAICPYCGIDSLLSKKTCRIKNHEIYLRTLYLLV